MARFPSTHHRPLDGARSPSAARAIALGLALSMAVVDGAAAPARLRVGDALPPLEGDLLTGRSVALPAAAAGKVTLILMGFTYASRAPVEEWGTWFRQAIDMSGGITFFEVPMIGGLGRLGRWFIDRGMRKGTPAELHEHVLTVYSKAGDWKKRLGHASASEDDAFLIVLDRQGVVRWLHHGAFDATRAAELQALLRSLAAAP